MLRRPLADHWSLGHPFSGWRLEPFKRGIVAGLLLVLAGGAFVACDIFSSEEVNEPPSVQIISPDEGASYSETEEVQFEAEATDPDGSITEGSLVWRSSIDGQFGQGPTAAVTLSAGTHDIWAVARDKEGTADSVSISISIDALPYGMEPAFPSLQFDRPTNMVPSPDGDRFYLSEQNGVIRVFPAEASVSEAPVFVDLSDRVLLQEETSAEGLLGFTLDPEFDQNGYFYVLYTAAGPNGGREFSRAKGEGIRTILSRVEATGPSSAMRSSEEILLEVDQPYRWHNGGQLAFGPQDGLLYISLGDGGSAGDPDDRAQNTYNLYGTILRIDPDGATDDVPYGIPPDNPFTDTGERSEIFAYGLRNIWRFSFSPDGRIWGGDVGQGQWEEIDIIEKGENYGWDHREGAHCFEPDAGCRTEGLVDPISDYGRSKGRSVTGGYVYHGSRLPDLQGTYIYGDYVSLRVWSLSFNGSSAGENRLIARNPALRDGPGGLVSFAEGLDGHLYLLGLDGRIYHLTPRDEPS